MDDVVAEAMATPPDDSTLSDPPTDLEPLPDQGIPSPQSVAEPVDSITVEIPQKRTRRGQATTTPPQPSPQASSRTKRARRGPIEDKEVELARSRTTRGAATRTPSARIKGQIWTPNFLLAEPKSKLVHCRLVDLINAETWAMLSSEDRVECASHLPKSDLKTMAASLEEQSSMEDTIAVDPLGFTLADGFFENNVALQDDMRTFQEDLSEGRFQASFLENAALARRRRLRGDFDKWKDAQYELWWGQNQKLASGMLAGDTTKLRITDMAKTGMLRTGDIWRYSRTFGKVSQVTTVKKELKCTDISDSFSLTFDCPHGKAEYVSADVAPFVIEDVDNPTKLETLLLDEDGRIPRGERPNGNAFKAIRIVRGTEDIGSLFDVRMSAFDKLTADK